MFDTIDPDKDVDGFTPVNVGRLVQGRAVLMPCTPSGVIEMLVRSGIRIAGTRAVVIGRSEIVGKPMAMLLLQRDATVTICHSKTPDLPGVAAAADILVAAIGRPGFVTPAFVKPGATVIDVGTTQVSDTAIVQQLFAPDSPRRADFERRGSLVVGDVHPAVVDVAGALTPVPGGVGPLTIAMLLKNTVAAARARSRPPLNAAAGRAHGRDRDRQVVLPGAIRRPGCPGGRCGCARPRGRSPGLAGARRDPRAIR